MTVREFLVDINYRVLAETVCVTPPKSPILSVFFRVSRHFLSILPIVFTLTSWCCLDCSAQLADGRNRFNRHDRDMRSVQSVNPAQAMMQEMQASLKSLPWNDLSADAQLKIKSVVSGAPLFRRLPQQTIYADPEIYHFLLQHPDMVIGFWEHLGATQLTLREIKQDRFILKEAAGTTAAVEVLYRTNDLCIVYAKGEYRGPLIAKPYSGDVVLVLRSRFLRDDMNEPMVVCDLDAFVQINSLGADILAKLFFTSLAKTADSNFEVTVSFVGHVSKAAARNTDGLKGSAEEISSIRQEVYAEFCDVVDRTAMRFARRNLPIPLASASMQRLTTVPQRIPDELPIEQPAKPTIEEPQTSSDFFASLSKPPAEWGMDHLHNTSPFFEEVRENDSNKLNAPNVLNSSPSRYYIPKLPKPMK